MSAKNLYIKTYGCQMNVYDSARMADVLTPLGYVQVDGPEQADMVILNTCHIREKAAEKVYSELGRLKLMKQAKQKAGRDMMIAVGGCVAQAEGEEMMRRAPVVDMVFGPQTYQDLPEMIARAEENIAQSGRGRVVHMEFAAQDKFDRLPEEAAPQGVSAFLTIQEGCDKFCTFCVVPYTRGAEISRPVADVLAEAKRLVASGAREITLLGQNVNAYHGDLDGRTASLGELIMRLAEIDGLARLRYTTSHPRDVDDELIRAHAEVPQLMPFLHLPVQSGSDTILDAMNRKHTAARYLEIVGGLRAGRPDLMLSSDFIVGFPGETDADFQATMDLVRQVGFIQAYSFNYSPRPGTPAADVEDQIPLEVKSARLAELQAELNGQQKAFNESCVGAVMPVLFDRPGRHQGQLAGRSPWLQAVAVDVRDDLNLHGQIAEVEITRAASNSLIGRLVDQPRVAAE